MVPLEELFFQDAIKLEKMYRSCFQDVAAEYHFSPNEIAVLLFVGQNAPEQDTATDIAQARGISKALVARSVDRLYRRGFLAGVRDEKDRRVVHLRLCGEGISAFDRLQDNCRVVAERLQRDISEEEWRAAHSIMVKMQHNLDALLAEKER